MNAKKIAQQMIDDPPRSSGIFQNYVMAAKTKSARLARFKRVQEELAKKDYKYVGQRIEFLELVEEGDRFGEFTDPYSLEWRGLSAGPELDIARANFFEALDQQHEFESLEEAFDIYADNVADTAVEQKVDANMAVEMYFELVRRQQEGREDNPGWLTVGGAALAGTMLGAAGTFAGVGGNPDPRDDYVELEEYEGAILMFPVEGSTGLGWAVNQCTGKLGYSHCGLDVGLVNPEGTPLWIDSWAGEGILLRPPDKFDREPVRIHFSEEEAAHVRAVALHILHQRTPYRGGRGGLHCSEFVVACLPRSMIERYNIPKNATPNQLAVCFGLVENPKKTKTLKRKLLR